MEFERQPTGRRRETIFPLIFLRKRERIKKQSPFIGRGLLVELCYPQRRSALCPEFGSVPKKPRLLDSLNIWKPELRLRHKEEASYTHVVRNTSPVACGLMPAFKVPLHTEAAVGKTAQFWETLSPCKIPGQRAPERSSSTAKQNQPQANARDEERCHGAIKRPKFSWAGKLHLFSWPHWWAPPMKNLAHSPLSPY